MAPLNFIDIVDTRKIINNAGFQFTVRAVTIETLFTVTDPMVPEIRGFAKRSGNQNEVPDWRKRDNKITHFGENFQNSENFKFFTKKSF